MALNEQNDGVLFQNSQEWRERITSVIACDLYRMQEIPLEHQTFEGEGYEEGQIIGQELIQTFTKVNEASDQYKDSRIVGALNDLISVIAFPDFSTLVSVPAISRQRYLKTFMGALISGEISDHSLRSLVTAVFQRAIDKRGEFSNVMYFVLEELETEGRLPRRRLRMEDVII